MKVHVYKVKVCNRDSTVQVWTGTDGEEALKVYTMQALNSNKYTIVELYRDNSYTRSTFGRK